ncbi:putative Ras GTPase-activating protein-binding protein [Helianthus annuus]|nr:putative Ras GTPase-activating protein-binding protein [Helianthus annuus]
MVFYLDVFGCLCFVKDIYVIFYVCIFILNFVFILVATISYSVSTPVVYVSVHCLLYMLLLPDTDVECVVQMASQAASPAAVLPSAQVVGNAFVDQYYHILHQSPELVHKFYQDSSILSRPDTNGLMSSVTTMQGFYRSLLGCFLVRLSVSGILINIFPILHIVNFSFIPLITPCLGLKCAH